MNALASIAEITANYRRVRQGFWQPAPVRALPAPVARAASTAAAEAVAEQGEPIEPQFDAHVRAWRRAKIGLLVSAKVIEREVSAKHEISLDEIKGQRRLAYLMPARFELAYRLRTEAGLSFPQIGRRMGGRDHTTALHSYRKHAARIQAEASR